MLNKFLLTSFISASLLISTCGAMDETPSLTLSVKKLERGYNSSREGQSLELKDGTKWLVTNQYSWSEPTFRGINPKEKFYGAYDSQQKAFSFDHVVPGGPAYKWNDETKQYEIDYETFMPDMHFFHLNVKQIIEEKALVLKIEERAPQDFIELGGLRIPKAMCKWNPLTQEFTLDFSSLPQLSGLLNSQFHPGQQNNPEIENKPAVLQIENNSPQIKIEEIKNDEMIEQNSPSNFQTLSNSNQEEKVITSLSLTLAHLETGFNTGTVTLEDGTKWTVTNASSWATPMFVGWISTFDGYYNSSNDEFYFNHSSPLEYEKKWNEETKQYEDDYTKPMGGIDYFNLIVKRSK